MAILQLAPAIRSSTKIVRAQTNKVVLRLVPEIKNGEVASNRTFIVFLGIIFTAGLLSLLLINTALVRDAFVLSELKVQAQLLTDQREAILQEVAAKSSPDKLAQRASELGMVASSSPRFLDMSVGKS